MQHRTAIRAGREPLRRYGGEFPLFLRAEDDVHQVQRGVRHISGRLRHARRAVRGDHAHSDGKDFTVPGDTFRHALLGGAAALAAVARARREQDRRRRSRPDVGHRRSEGSREDRGEGVPGTDENGRGAHQGMSKKKAVTAGARERGGFKASRHGSNDKSQRANAAGPKGAQKKAAEEREAAGKKHVSAEASRFLRGKSCLIPLIEAGFVDWIISTGANLYHDTHFGLGLSMHRGNPTESDVVLREEGVVRIYDIFFDYDVLLSTDAFFRKIIRAPEFQRAMSSAEFHWLCGKYVAAREKVLGLKSKSLLSAAYTCGVPVYTSSPGDRSIGMNVAALSSDLLLSPSTF